MKQQLIEAILDLRPEDQSVEELLPTLEGKTDGDLLKDLVTSAKWYKQEAAKTNVKQKTNNGVKAYFIGRTTKRSVTYSQQSTTPDAVRWGYEPEKPQSNEE